MGDFMQTKVLEQLKKKYEYLDFDNAIVLACFRDAMDSLKKDNPGILENESLFPLELEHYFLYYLVLECQKDNKEIYDAISIAMENISSMFIRRRKDLADKFNEKNQKLLYEKAFKITINNYYKRMRLSSKLIENLKAVYEDAVNDKKEDNDMPYNLTQKSLYDLFGEYDKKLADTIFRALKQKEESSYSILVKKYGINLDGKNAGGLLSYGERNRIDSIISRLRSWFEYGDYLLKNGNSYKEIQDFFVKTKDESLAGIFSKFYKKKEEDSSLLDKKSEILKKFSISEKELEDSIYYIEDNNKRIAYKYHYGIGCKKMDESEILDMLGMKKDEYKESLISVQRSLLSLIKKAKEAGDFDRDKTSGSKKSSDSKTGVKKVKPKVIIPSKNNDIDVKYLYFVEYFYTKEMTEEEKDSLSAKIYKSCDSFIDFINEHDIIKKLYGNDLKQKCEIRKITEKENKVLEQLISKIRERLVIEEKGNAMPQKKRRTRKDYFIEYIYDEKMTDDEKSDIQNKLNEFIEYLKQNYMVGYTVCSKLYGKDFNSNLSNYKTTRQEKDIFKTVVLKAKKFLVNYNSNNNSSYLEESFYNYFYTEEMTDDEKNNIEEKVKKVLTLNSDTKSYKLLFELYDESLKLKKDINITKYQKATIKKFVGIISRGLTLNLDDLPKKEKDFYDYFYSYGMTDEEKVKMKEEIIKIVNYLKKIFTKGYEVSVLLYGDDLSEKRKNLKITSNQASNLNSFRSKIKSLYGKELKSIDDKYISYKKRPLKFSMYFYKYGMSLEEQKAQDLKIKEILEKNDFAGIKGYEIAKKLYGEDLNKEFNYMKIDEKERFSFGVFLKKIKQILNGSSKKEIKVQNENKSNNRYKQLFFEYFYTDEMTDDEKQEINKKVLLFLKETQILGVVALYKIYDRSTLINQNLDLSLTRKESANFYWLKYEIEKYINGEKVRIPRNNKRPAAFVEYFYTDEMSDDEKKYIAQELNKFLDERKNTQGYSCLKRVYGEDFKTLQKGYDSSDAVACNNLRVRFLERLKKLKIKEDKSKHDKVEDKNVTLINKTIEKTDLTFPDIPALEEEKIIVEIEEENHEMVGENIDHTIEKKENVILKIETEKEEEIKEDIEEKILINNKNYIENLILKLYNDSFTPEEIKESLSISDNDFINTCINNLNEIKSIDSILDYILIKNPNKLKYLFESEYFSSFREYLTEKEQELVYLKLLSKVKSELTDEVISLLTGLSLESISDYQIMTKDDSLNYLNEYIKRPINVLKYKKLYKKSEN